MRPPRFKTQWSRRRKITLILLVGVPLLILVLVIIFIRQMNSPAVGTVKNPLPQNKAAKKDQNGTKIYDGKTISFAYPANYETVESPQNPNYLDVINLFSTDHTDTHLAVTVVKEALANDPSFNLRRSHPDTYKQILASPTDVVFTSSKDGSEETEYIAHSGLVASLSMTVPGPIDISKQFVIVTNSLQWKQ